MPLLLDMNIRSVTAFRKAHGNRALLLSLPGAYPNLPVSKEVGERLVCEVLESGAAIIVAHPDDSTTLVELPDLDWVRVTDALPDDGVNVLACWNGDPDTMEAAYYDGAHWMRSTADVVFQTPSHWRHLPDAPSL